MEHVAMDELFKPLHFPATPITDNHALTHRGHSWHIPNYFVKSTFLIVTVFHERLSKTFMDVQHDDLFLFCLVAIYVSRILSNMYHCIMETVLFMTSTLRWHLLTGMKGVYLLWHKSCTGHLFKGSCTFTIPVLYLPQQQADEVTVMTSY